MAAAAPVMMANVNMAISGYGFTQDVFDKIRAIGINGLSVSLNDGVICERCWNRISKEDILEGNLCKRCNDVVNGK